MRLKCSGIPSNHFTRLARWGPSGPGVRLGFPQLAGYFEDRIGFGAGAAVFKFEHAQVGGQQASAAPASMREQGRDLSPKGDATEQRGELRAVFKLPLGLVQAPAVTDTRA